MPNDLQLMYLMCSRFCHDLAAPLSAISIGLEMLPDDESPDSPNKILKFSVQSAINKLELMRCLCGYATSQDKPNLKDVRAIIEKSIDPTKITLKWLADASLNIKGESVRLLIALIMIAIESLPRGGEITINTDFSITLQGNLVKLNEEVVEAMTCNNSINNTSSRGVIGYFTHLLCQRVGLKIIIDNPKPNLIIIKYLEI